MNRNQVHTASNTQKYKFGANQCSRMVSIDAYVVFDYLVFTLVYELNYLGHPSNELVPVYLPVITFFGKKSLSGLLKNIQKLRFCFCHRIHLVKIKSFAWQKSHTNFTTSISNSLLESKQRTHGST